MYDTIYYGRVGVPFDGRRPTVTTEFDLACTNCDAQLTRQRVTTDSLGVPASVESIEIAECPDCGGRYFPESALRDLG